MMRYPKFFWDLLRDDKVLPELWAAFCKLVKSLLLPMAAVNVIHADIRSTDETTYNILYRIASRVAQSADAAPEVRLSQSVDAANARNEIELCLIDFDSLLLYDLVEDAKLKSHDHAIYWKYLKKTLMIDKVDMSTEGKEEDVVMLEEADELQLTDDEKNKLELSNVKDYWGSAYKYLFWQDQKHLFHIVSLIIKIFLYSGNGWERILLRSLGNLISERLLQKLLCWL
jgi:hypothetical protein